MDDADLSKRLSRAFSRSSRLLFAFLLRALFGPTNRAKADPARVRDVLVLRNDRLGDLIISLGALAAVKLLNPAIRLHAVGSQWNRAYLDLDPLFDTAHTLYTKKARVPGRAVQNLRTLWRLRGQRFDVVLDMLNDNRKESNPLLALILSRGALRVGFGKGLFPGSCFDRFVPEGSRDRHAALEMDRLVAEAFELPPGFAFPAPRPYSPPEAEVLVDGWMRDNSLTSYCVFNFTAGREDREYPVEKFARVARELLEACPELTIAATASPSERAKPEAFVRAVGSPRCLVFTGPLAHWSEFIRRAALVATPDTATSHLAAAWGRPVLGLYDARPYKEKVWFPFATDSEVIYAERIPDIPEAEVVRAFLALYGRTTGQTGSQTASQTDGPSQARAGGTPW